MHLILSKNLQAILLRHIDESYIKEKWIMKIETIKKIQLGYDNSSPIETSTYIFS
jgi:hypothetical protein